ncbi:MAG: flagellar motor protein [Gammaproteobacteria bacterium]|nr:flagellar motor protein [Gammaproteobacteria bacterium]
MSSPSPLKANLWINPDKYGIYGLSTIAAIVFIGVSTALFKGSLTGVILLDSDSEAFRYPFTIHNLMHLLFFLGAGDLYVRWRNAQRERNIVRLGLIPVGESSLTDDAQLLKIRKKSSTLHSGEQGYLPSLIDLAIVQFLASRSVDQTLSVINSSLDLATKRVELQYAFSRYLVWVIPTIGFVGTVVHMSLALKGIDPKAPDLGHLTASLGVSFYTTLVALIESAILVLFLNLIEAQEEGTIVDAGQYVLKNLINRLPAS